MVYNHTPAQQAPRAAVPQVHQAHIAAPVASNNMKAHAPVNKMPQAPLKKNNNKNEKANLLSDIKGQLSDNSSDDVDDIFG